MKLLALTKQHPSYILWEKPQYILVCDIPSLKYVFSYMGITMVTQGLSVTMVMQGYGVAMVIQDSH